MENTVTISLNYYNELKKVFKNKIEDLFCYSITIDRFCHEKQFITTDEAIKEIAEANEKLLLEINDFKRNFNKMQLLKNMSIWEFLKWRKS